MDPGERYGLRVTLLALGLVLVAAPFATLTYQVVGDGAITRLDGRLADDLNQWIRHRPLVQDVVRWVSHLGSTALLTVVVSAVVVWLWLWWPQQRRRAVYLGVTALLAGVLNTAVKVAVDRPRPVVDHPMATAPGMSFPSGHAMGSTACFGAVLVTVWPFLPARARRWVPWAVVVVVSSVGATRVLLGVHFLSDVVAGHLLGLAWLAVATATFGQWQQEEGAEERADEASGPPPDGAGVGHQRARAGGGERPVRGGGPG